MTQLSHKESSLKPDSLLTSYQVGALLQVNPSSVNKWVKDGRIPAFRTPGGHRRIRAADVMAFLRTHKMPTPPGLTQLAQKRVLLVDADPQSSASISHALTPIKTRLALKSADNSIDALVQVGAFSPEVVVLADSIAPLDSLSMCRSIVAMKTDHTVHVIMLFKRHDAALTQAARQAGAQASLFYPIDGATLLGTIEAACAS